MVVKTKKIGNRGLIEIAKGSDGGLFIKDVQNKVNLYLMPSEVRDLKKEL